MNDEYSFPIDDPVDALGSTANGILEAAKRITRDKGFSELTFDAIVEESGANRASIRYHFGNKAGLIAAMVNSLIHADVKRLREEIESAKGNERLRRYVAGKQRISEGNEHYRTYFEVLPYLLREDSQTRRLGQVYDWYRRMNRESLAAGVDARYDIELDGLASLTVAVADGLGLQHCLVDQQQGSQIVARAYAVLEEMLALWLRERLVAHASPPQTSSQDSLRQS